jgi:uncharacterized membrane protein YbhN (UPF0104 family)
MNKIQKLRDTLIGLIGLFAGLTGIVVVIVVYIALLFGFAYVWDFVFHYGGALSVAANKNLAAAFTLLPGFIAYWTIREVMRQSNDYSSLPLARKILVHLKHLGVMLFVCAVIAYSAGGACDESGWCESGDASTREDDNVTFLRLTIISLLGMLLAYGKRDAFADRK